MRILMGFIVSIIFSFPALAAATWTVAQHMQVRTVRDATLPPDAAQVAFSLVHWPEGGMVSSEVWIKKIGGDGMRISEAGQRAHSPRWSPDGGTLAFVSNGDIWFYDTSSRQAERITAAGGISALKWSPDGSRLAYVQTTTVHHEGQIGPIDWTQNHDFPAKALYVATIKGKALVDVRQVSSNGASVDHQVAYGFDWSPDGRHVAFAQSRGDRVGDWTSSRVYVVDVARRSLDPEMISDQIAFNPVFSPDGGKLAFVAAASSHVTRDIRPYVLERKSGKIFALAPTHTRDPLLLGWTADGLGIIFAEARGTGSVVGVLGLDSALREIPVPRLISGLHLLHEGYVGDWHAAIQQLVVTMEDSVTAPEAYRLNVISGEAQPLTAVNADIPTKGLRKADVVRWLSRDGMAMEGLLYRPVVAAGKPIPTITYLHGGPSNVAQEVFAGRPWVYPIAALTEAGYAVFLPNFRGSLGYDMDFRRANIQQLGHADMEDVLSGVDHLIKEGIADADRLGIVGWSYGGYLALATIVRDARFTVASIGAAPVNLTSYYGTSDFPELFADYLGGTPATVPQTYLKHSPIFGVGRIQTPLLIQHGDQDRRVPVGQAMELYTGLKGAGLPVRFSLYKGAGHVLLHTAYVKAAMEENLAWLANALLKSPPSSEGMANGR